VSRLHLSTLVAGLLAAGLSPAPAQAEPPAPGSPEAKPAAPAAASQNQSAPAAPQAPSPAETRDREVQELKRIIDDLRKRVDELEKRPTPPAPPVTPPTPPDPQTPPPDLPPPSPPPIGAGATQLPNISAIGNIQFRAGDSGFIPNRGRFNFNEFELAFQDAVTPKLRYDVFLAAAKEEDFVVGLEEGFLTASALAKGLSARAGRIRTPFGKFNRLHPHQWRHITQPTVISAYLGPEGLLTDGAVAEYRLPFRKLFAQFELGRWETSSEAEDGFGFAGGGTGGWSGRLWLGKEVGRDRELELGFSRYMGRGQVDGFGRKSQAVNGFDLTYRTYPDAYRRLFLTLEMLLHETDGIRNDTKRSLGGFATAAYRWNRYWEAGVRGDYAKFPFPLKGREIAGSLFVTKYLTEQTSLRVEYRHADSTGFGNTNGIFFQVLFGSGPHAHPLQ